MKKQEMTKIINCPCECGQTYKSDVVMADKKTYRIKAFAQAFSDDDKLTAGDVIHISLYECPNCKKSDKQ